MTKDIKKFTEEEFMETLKKNIFGRGWEGKLALPQWKQKTDELDWDLKNLLDIVTQMVKDDVETQASITILEDQANKLENWQNRAEDKSEELNLAQRVCSLEDDVEALGNCTNKLVDAVPKRKLDRNKYGVNEDYVNRANFNGTVVDLSRILESSTVLDDLPTWAVGAKIREIVTKHGTAGDRSKMAEEVVKHFKERENNDR